MLVGKQLLPSAIIAIVGSRQQQTQSDLSGKRVGRLLSALKSSHRQPPALPAGTTCLHQVLSTPMSSCRAYAEKKRMNSIIHPVISYLCTKQSPSNICHFCLHRSCVNSFQRYSFLQDKKLVFLHGQWLDCIKQQFSAPVMCHGLYRDSIINEKTLITDGPVLEELRA